MLTLLRYDLLAWERIIRYSLEIDELETKGGVERIQLRGVELLKLGQPCDAPTYTGSEMNYKECCCPPPT